MSMTRHNTDASLRTCLLHTPPEIIEEIFANACIIDFDGLSQPTTPLKLGSVCKAWREIAWSIPQLWSDIIITASPLTRTQLELLNMWLQNSRARPLSICLNPVDDFTTPAEWDRNPPTSALRELVKHCERWEYLDIFIPCNAKSRFVKVLGRVRGRVPLLRDLKLRHLENLDMPRAQLDMFNNAHRLTRFTVELLYMDDITIPWTNLTSLRTQLSPQECVEALSRCPNLVDCILFSAFDAFDEEANFHFTFPPSSMVSLQNLVSLSITFTHPVSGREECLAVPAVSFPPHSSIYIYGHI
ncbi:hypothetical protein BDQ17DRAFT_1430145 [Cyathus striatus]|nr:hypothetical protein BDQ17DRAFT_1430145 [Cyathus striatus]